MSELGIEAISVFGLPPTKFIELAAELGCPNISMSLNLMDYNPEGYARYSVVEDAALRREIRSALEANGVRIALGENLAIQPGTDMEAGWRKTLDILCGELGAKSFNSVSFEGELAANVEYYGRLCEVAAEYDVRALIEFVPIFPLADLATTLEIIRQVGSQRLGLIADMMHLARTNVSAEDLAAVPDEFIGHIQICDVPQSSDIEYMDEAMHERLAPGDGDVPLADYLRALPLDRVIGLEIPQRALAEQEIGPKERLSNCVAKTRELLKSLP